ncbi:MAG: type II toxin-antitoxin system Phd/YefM family antitoxin [Methyloprofundus sp.]|nr:type II toxin-antitoxin system Phd/YefM family antitoxin [Methyloprofundus sp.]
MSMSLTALRQQLFSVVDQVIATGVPIEIKRNGHIIKIVLDDKKSKLANLVAHDCIVGDPDELVDLSVQEWDAENNI